MKYIKRINEGFTNLDNFREMCNTYLIALIDDGFTIDVYEKSGSKDNNIIIEITKYEGYIGGSDWLEFNWSEVKYEIIPLLQMIKDFDVDFITFNKYKDTGFNKKFTLKEIVEDNIEDLSSNKLFINLSKKERNTIRRKIDNFIQTKFLN